VLISPKLPLSLERIVILWATEIWEGRLEEIARPLLLALIDGKIKPAAQKDADWLNEWVLRTFAEYLEENARLSAYDSLPRDTRPPLDTIRSFAAEWDEFYRTPGTYEIEASGRPDSHMPDVLVPITAILDHLLRIEVSRDELLRWAAEEGYAPPKFWDVGVSEPSSAPAPTPTDAPSPAVTPAAKKNPRGPVPVQTPRAIANLRAALAADPTLRERVLTEKELQHLCGGVSREIARKARDEVLGK
jgi:hypothetical protein